MSDPLEKLAVILTITGNCDEVRDCQ